MPVYYRKKIVAKTREQESIIDRGLSFLKDMIQIKIDQAEKNVQKRLKEEERKIIRRMK